jgi:hypothetical protein
VTLSFLEHGAATRLVVDQGSFATRTRLSLHEEGWADALDGLERYLA